MTDRKKLEEYKELFRVIKENKPESILSKELEELWNVFLDKFNEDKLRHLRLEEYVLDKERPEESFCYWIERRLKMLGNMLGSYADKFGIYLDRESRNLKVTKKFGGGDRDPDIAYKKIKNEILNLILAGKNKDLDKIIGNKLSTMLKAKILFLYFPDRFLPILSGDDIEFFLAEFDIPHDKTIDPVNKREILITSLKDKDPIMKIWTNQEFSWFLYHFYNPRNSKYLNQIGSLRDENEQEALLKKMKGIKREDIIAELSTFVPSAPEKIKIGNIAYKRDNKTIAYLKILREFKCQICEKSILKRDRTRYVEAAHIIPKKEGSNEAPSNIILLCPNHHKEFDLGKRIDISKNQEEYIFEINEKRYVVDLSIK